MPFGMRFEITTGSRVSMARRAVYKPQVKLFEEFFAESLCSNSIERVLFHLNTKIMNFIEVAC